MQHVFSVSERFQPTLIIFRSVVLKLPGSSRVQRLGDPDLPSLVKRLKMDRVTGETDDLQAGQLVAMVTG